MNKKYLVIFQDEYNNLYYVGEYKNLDASIDDLNMYLDAYNVKLKKGDLREYPSTFGTAFDLSLSDMFEEKSELMGVMVRGFVFEEGD